MDSKKVNKILGGLLIVSLIYIVIMQGCGDRFGGGSGSGGNVDTIQVDTIVNITEVDTITVYNTDTIYRYISVEVPVPYYITDTGNTVVAVNTDDFDDFFEERPVIYEDSVSDDTISIHYRIRTWGFIDKIELGYSVLSSYYIKERSVLETAVITQKKNFGFYAGLDAGMNKDGLAHLEPSIELVTPKVTYNIGYDMVDRAIMGGVRLRLRLKRK